MLINHLKIAWRSILKNKLFSFINVVGLSIGLCSALVIGAIIYFDFSFDTFHKDKDRIYRVTSLFKSGNDEFTNRGVPVPLMQTFKDGVSGVEEVAPFMSANFSKVENKSQEVILKNVNDGIFARNLSCRCRRAGASGAPSAAGAGAKLISPDVNIHEKNQTFCPRTKLFSERAAEACKPSRNSFLEV